MQPTPAQTSFRFRAPIPEEAVRHFVDQGFIVVEDLLDGDEIRTLGDDLVRIARGAYPCDALRPAPASLSDREILEGILCIHQPHQVSPVMRQAMLHAKVAGVLSRIVGAHLPFWDGSVNAMQSMLFVKPPGKPGQAWHQDEMYIPTRDRSLCGAWIAIDEATVANGCLWVLPGSHRMGNLHPLRTPDLEEYDGSPECHGFDDRAAVPVEVKPGSVVFFNGYLLHRSLRNRSAIHRRSLVSHYCNGWTMLPWHAPDISCGGAPAQPVARATYRGIVPLCGTDAYAWQGTTPPADHPHLRGFGRSWLEQP